MPAAEIIENVKIQLVKAWLNYNKENYQQSIVFLNQIINQQQEIERSLNEEGDVPDYIEIFQNIITEANLAKVFCYCRLLLVDNIVRENVIAACGQYRSRPGLTIVEIVAVNRAISGEVGDRFQSSGRELRFRRFLADTNNENSFRIMNEIVNKQIFWDCNHRTAVFLTYLIELKQIEHKYLKCKAYRIFANFELERYRYEHGSEPTNFSMDKYQEYQQLRTRNRMNNRTSLELFIDKFIEVCNLSAFLDEICRFGQRYENYKKLRTNHWKDFTQNERNKATYKQFKSLYKNYMQLGGGYLRLDL